MQRAFSGQPEPTRRHGAGCLVQGRSGLTGPLSCRNTASHRCIACRYGCRALPLHPLARAGFFSPAVSAGLRVSPVRSSPFPFYGRNAPAFLVVSRFLRRRKKAPGPPARSGAAIRVLSIRSFDSPSVGMIQIRSAGRSRCFLSAPAGAPCCRAQYSAFCVGCQITAPAQWRQ